MNTHDSNQKCWAVTLIEVLVVTFVIAFLTFILLPSLIRPRDHSRIFCVNNMKQIGLAFRIWAGDNNGKYPMQVSTADGGAMEPATNGNAAAVFQVMSNELCTPKIVICPQDTAHVVATNFADGNFTGRNISYFAGLNANQQSPQTILSGDDNFKLNGAPVKPGGVIALSTNAMYLWNHKRHDRSGNIAFSDGSVQILANAQLEKLVRRLAASTNHLAIP